MSAKCDCKDCAFRGMELCEQRKLMEENAKLREALKPIMECCITELEIGCIQNNEHFKNYIPAYNAVRKAQAIMKGGAE